VVFHPSGQFLGYTVAGCGNPAAVGPETAAASVAEGVMGPLRRAKVSTRIRLVVLAMAGAGRTSVAAEIRRRLAGIGLDAPLIFESDLLATYFSGAHRPDGYAVIAGTGAGAIRVGDARQVAVADALG
jgi:N-acetylglucosamine kinase-like BadF-type ATPase